MSNNSKKNGFAKWNDELQRVLDEATPIDRILTVFSLACSFVIIILALLLLLDIWEGAFMVFAPLMGVQMLLQAKLCWKANQKTAKKYLVAAAVIWLIVILLLIFA